MVLFGLTVDNLCYKLLYDETSLKLLITQYTVVALLSVAFAFVSGLQFLWDLTQHLL